MQTGDFRYCILQYSLVTPPRLPTLLFPQYIVDKLFWPETPLLEAVGLHEPHVDRLRERVGHAISQSLIPLLAYCQQYQPYVDLMNLNIKTYIE